MLCTSITIDSDSALIAPMAVFCQTHSNITVFISHRRMLSAFTLINWIFGGNFRFRVPLETGNQPPPVN